MNEYIERIENAAARGDRQELKRIVHTLVVIGVCDLDRASAILTHTETEAMRLAA